MVFGMGDMVGRSWWALLACPLASIWGPLPPLWLWVFPGAMDGGLLLDPGFMACWLFLVFWLCWWVVVGAGLGPAGQWQPPLRQPAGPVWFSPPGGTARDLAGGCGFGLLVLGVGFLGWFLGPGYDHRLDVHLHLWPFCLVLVPFWGLVFWAHFWVLGV